MTFASLGYVVNDGLVRKVTEEGAGVYQVLCMRSIGLATLFGVAGIVRGETTQRRHLQAPLLLRVAAEVIAAALFFAAVVRIEFANAQALVQVLPFLVTLAAAIVRGEKVALSQYLTILLGFVGVIVIVRPATDGFSAWSLVVLLAASVLVVRELATRRVDSTTPLVSISFVTAVGLALLTGALSLPGWVALPARAYLWLTLSVIALVVGYVFSIETIRVGDLSVSAPFRYVVLPGAVVIGYLLFGEVPDQFTIVGSLIILATGVFAVQSERTRNRLARPSVSR